MSYGVICERAGTGAYLSIPRNLAFQNTKQALRQGVFNWTKLDLSLAAKTHYRPIGFCSGDESLFSKEFLNSKFVWGKLIRDWTK